MASRVGHYLLFDTLGTGTFAKYVGLLFSRRARGCSPPRRASALSLSWLYSFIVVGEGAYGVSRFDRDLPTDVSCCVVVLFAVLVLDGCAGCVCAG